LEIKEFMKLKKVEKGKVKRVLKVKWHVVLDKCVGRIVTFGEIRDFVKAEYDKNLSYQEWYRAVAKWQRDGHDIDIRKDEAGRVYYGIDIHREEKV